ncbi:hypothetical protein KSF73_04990 [Burkholderiaceae bacterium DAT-1]|nr:hypothetical protein [Burkholderiaceae bacterium DAT-1]
MAKSQRFKLMAFMLVALLFGSFAIRYYVQHTKPKQIVMCNNLVEGCVLQMGKRTIRVSADQQPAMLRPFTLTVENIRKPVTLKLAMMGMDMGPLQFPMQKASDTVQTLKVSLPFCVQGRRDWVMRIQTEDGGLDVGFNSLT